MSQPSPSLPGQSCQPSMPPTVGVRVCECMHAPALRPLRPLRRIGRQRRRRRVWKCGDRDGWVVAALVSTLHPPPKSFPSLLSCYRDRGPRSDPLAAFSLFCSLLTRLSSPQTLPWTRRLLTRGRPRPAPTQALRSHPSSTPSTPVLGSNSDLRPPPGQGTVFLLLLALDQ